MPVDIKKGDLYGDLHYFSVESVTEFAATFKDIDSGEEWSIPIKFLSSAIKDAWSASTFTKEEKVCREQIILKLIEAGVRPFTVDFVKADGQDRTIRGQFIKNEPLRGRSIIRDFDESGHNKIKSIDNRTIKSLVLDGVRYYV